MNLHNKTFLCPDSPFSDLYFSFYFADREDHGFMNSEFTIGDGGNVLSFNGDSAADLKTLEALIGALETFRNIAAGRLAQKHLDERG